MSTNDDSVHRRQDHDGTGSLSVDGWFDVGSQPSHEPERENPDHYRSWLQPADDDTAAVDLVRNEPAPDTAGSAPTGAAAVRRTWWWILVAALGCAAIAVGVLVFAPFRSSELAPARESGAPVQPSLTAAIPVCPSSPDVPRFDGRGAGSTSSGPEAVLALEHGYYVERTASAVRAVLVPGGPFGSDAEIQSGIDDVPVGTTHCVQIAEAGPHRWAVTITEHRPAGSVVVLHQLITTAMLGDRTLVSAVTPA